MTSTRTRSARLPDRDLAAIGEADRLGRGLGDGTHRLRQRDAGRGVGQAQRRHQETRRHVIGGQHVEHAGAGELGGRDVAGMGAAAHEIWRAHEHPHAAGVQRLRRLDGGREFGERDAILDRLRDVLRRRVVVARERNAAGAGERDERAVVRRGVAVRLLAPLLEHDVELGIGEPAGLAAVIVAQLLLVAELALAGRVVHQRDEPDVVAVDQCVASSTTLRHRHLAAQMEVMADPQHVGAARRGDRLGEQRRFAAHVLGAFLAPDAQRIEHRGDAAGRELRVVGHHRRHRVPVHLRPRHVMRFDVVGVELDEAGNDEVAPDVLGARRRRHRGRSR